MDTDDLCDHELVKLQPSTEAAKIAVNLVRYRDDLGGQAFWQTGASTGGQRRCDLSVFDDQAAIQIAVA